MVFYPQEVIIAGTFLIIIDLLIGQGEGMIVRRYGKKYGDGGMFFNAIICLFASVFFFVTDKGGLCFPKELWIYGIISSFLFATGFYTMYIAISTGSYVGTKMFSSFSGLIPVLYGILALKETAGTTTIIAIILICFSIFLNVYEKPKNRPNRAVPVKWYIYLLISAVSNGFITVVSRMQQIHFDHAYDNEFMIISFTGASAFLFVAGLIKERNKMKNIAGYGLLYGASAGMFNGAKNLLNLLIFLYMPISVATPLRQALGLLLSFSIAKILYKETYTKRKLLALFVGCVAIVLFKL